MLEKFYADKMGTSGEWINIFCYADIMDVLHDM